MGFPSAPVPAAREHAGGRNGCGEVHVFPFPSVPLLYAHLEISGETQNHLSMKKVAKTPKTTTISVLDRKVEGRRLSSDPVPPSPVSLPALLGQDRPAITVEAKWKGTDTGNSFMYC